MEEGGCWVEERKWEGDAFEGKEADGGVILYPLRWSLCTTLAAPFLWLGCILWCFGEMILFAFLANVSYLRMIHSVLLKLVGKNVLMIEG